jgi:hypothetical protein
MSNHLENILAEMEKNARIVELPGRNVNDIGTAFDAWSQARAERGAHQEAGNAFRKLAPTLTPEQHSAMYAQLHPDAQSAVNSPRGLFGRLGQRMDSGAAARTKSFDASQNARHFDTLKQHAPAAAAAHTPPAAGPGIFRRAAPYAVGAAALGAGGYALYRGIQNSSEQNARNSDYAGNMRHDLTSAMPSMTVTASYEKYASDKMADGNSSNGMLFASSRAAVAKSVADTLGSRLIADPLDAVRDTVKKRYYDEPKWQKNFHSVVSSDPVLSRAHAENPSMLTEAFESVKRFSPSLASDRLATRNLLKHVVMSGGEMDHSVMKMLAETEKAVTQSKQRQP